jgi:hypothetical protein
MIKIDYNTAHHVVEKNENLFWNGWDIVDWKADSLGEMSKDGMLKEGKWGIYKVYPLDKDGWDVPNKYAR